jgi:hypothetical protein
MHNETNAPGLAKLRETLFVRNFLAALHTERKLIDEMLSPGKADHQCENADATVSEPRSNVIPFRNISRPSYR